MTNQLRGRAFTGHRVAGRRVAGHRELSTAPTDGVEHHNPWPIRAAVIAALATLLATLGGLVFSALTSRQATEQARQAQIGQTSERFSRSVEQIGSGSIAVRIGGVYSFDSLMHDSEVDQQAIVEILSAFVRLQSGEILRQGDRENTHPAPVDLLSALKVLDAFGASGARDNSPSMLLAQVDLSGIDLQRIAMRRADLFAANLFGTVLSSANLSGANLGGARLGSAELQHADLSGAELFASDLTDADLNGADLSDSDLGLADLSGANLSDANLSGASLTSANLTDVTCSSWTKWPADFQPTPPCK